MFNPLQSFSRQKLSRRQTSSSTTTSVASSGNRLSSSSSSSSSSNTMYPQNSMSAFGLHEDALYSEIALARKRLAHGHVALSEATISDNFANATSSFLELWETEFARIGDFLQAQQHNLEFSAKALLTNVEAALGVETLADDEDNSNNKTLETEMIQNWRFKTEELVDACRKLQDFANHNKTLLEEIGTYADEKLQTGCVMGLRRRFAHAPWKNGPNSALIVVLSDIYGIIRAAEERLHSGSSQGNLEWVAPTCFERATTKYWVEDEQLTDLLLAAVGEAPLLVYGKSGRLTSRADCLSQRCEGDKLWDQLATPITSIYFDSPKMSLYKERLPRHEGSQLLRARWYGRRPTGNEVIFLEMKTHHEKWINTKSVKERVAIRERDMPRFLSLEHWTFDDAKEVALAASPTLDADALNKAGDRLLRMHELVFRHGLRPCVRTCYLRAAFQSSASNALRLTVDRNITMIDETKPHNGAWCLPEDAVIQNTMAIRVPFVVLEVKLAGDSPTPPVIQDLQDRGVILEATKFSKFLTGAAAFNTAKVRTLPHWAEHPAFAAIFSGQDMATAVTITNHPPTPQVITSHACDASTIKSDSKSDTTSTSSESHQKLETTHFFQSNSPSARRRSAQTEADPSSSAIAATMDDDEKPTPSATKSKIMGFFLPSKEKAPLAIAPKRFARVEPKSYFANERTFIQWISASLLLVTISVILLGIDSDNGTQSTYATKSGIAVCVGAVIIVFYATYVYFRRLHLLSSGAPYGYIDHAGPFVLAISVCGGVVVLLTHFLSEIKLATNGPPEVVYLHEEPGLCYLHSNRGISKLEYQPSDVIVDDKHNALLVPSVQRILSHSLDPPLPNRENIVKTLIEIPDSNLEGLTMVDDRVFALSEGPKKTELIELSWNNDEELDIVHRWKLSQSENAEAIAFVPDKTRRSGRLFIDFNLQIQVYNVPDGSATVPPAGDDDEDDDSLMLGTTSDATVEPQELERIGSLNNHVLQNGLTDVKISSMFYFEGIAYILHDNEVVLRAWDLDEGDLLAEIPLPRVEGGFSKEWEGIALERREVTDEQAKSLLYDRKGFLRGRADTETRSQLILHLALDTPAQVWSMVVEQTDKRGELILPKCAVSYQGGRALGEKDHGSSDSHDHAY